MRTFIKRVSSCHLLSCEMFFEIITCGPNEAMIISGVGHSPPTIISGGRCIVLPCVQKVQKLSLEVMTLLIDSKLVYTAQGVPISVTGVAQVKMTSSDFGQSQVQEFEFGHRILESFTFICSTNCVDV